MNSIRSWPIAACCAIRGVGGVEEVRRAVAAQVGGQDAIAGSGQGWRTLVERVRVVGEAVQQDDRQPAAGPVAS